MYEKCEEIKMSKNRGCIHRDGLILLLGGGLMSPTDQLYDFGQINFPETSLPQ